MTWKDAQLNPEEEINLKNEAEAQFGGLAECESIGFLFRKNKKEVVLATSRCHEDQSARFSFTIPAKWVVKIEYLEMKAPDAPPTEHRTQKPDDLGQASGTPRDPR